MKPLSPLDDRVVIDPIEEKKETPGGIVLPDTKPNKPTAGIVIAAGPGKLLDNGERAPMFLKVGDKVLFSKYAGREVEHDGNDLLILKECDIVATME